MKRLYIVGPYPPPIGGISVHISRMESFLKVSGIPYLIFNHGFFEGNNVIATKKSYLWYLKFLFLSSDNLVHFHQFSIFHYFYYYLFNKISSAKFIITIHEENLLYYNFFLKRIIIFLLQRIKCVKLITVSSRLTGFLLENRIHNICLPAYVPPLSVNKVTLKKQGDFEYFLYSVWKVDRVLSKNTYNIDLAFKLCNLMKDRFKMLFLVGTETESDKDYLTELLVSYNIEDSVTIIFEADLVNYLHNCKFLLRVNKVDGYGISLQEALEMKIPAIGSDVCVRPKGTILFKNDDIEDLLEKVTNIDKYWDFTLVEPLDYHLTLIEYYKQNLH